VRRRWMWVCCALLGVLLVGAALANAGESSTLGGTRFRLGGTVQFKVEDSRTWWWGCGSCCAETVVLGWRIVDGAGMTVYSVVHDAPVAASAWRGAWKQINASSLAVPAGSYMLYVDTSVGTLSRCFSLYDPCYSCRPCTSCCCEEVTSITSCECRASLVFIDSCTTGCFPFFWWFGCCTSPCTSCP
jgi:hypothetical protein